MKILCIMQFMPAANGTGGSQRAWFLLRALAKIAAVHLVIVHPANGLALSEDEAAALAGLAETVTLVAVPGWRRLSERTKLVHRRFGNWFDRLRIGSLHAPRFPRHALRAVAGRLPVRDVDLVFAARLPSAVIADALLAEGLLAARRKVVDFDDVLSKYFSREAAMLGWRKLDRKLDKVLDVALIRRSEAHLLRAWDGVSVCSPEDVGTLSAMVPGATVRQIPNVVERPLLPPSGGGDFTVLFIGNLGFGPNEQGLQRFLGEAWPAVRRALPRARLVVVGFNPPEALRGRLAGLGAELHSNVPSVIPYYEAAHVVIAPIFFGGGTRIKILEAMAFGRAVVATPIGAEGLALVHGRHAMIAAEMNDFAAAVVRLAADPALRATLARQARAFQEASYGEAMMSAAVESLVAGKAEEGGVQPAVR